MFYRLFHQLIALPTLLVLLSGMWFASVFAQEDEATEELETTTEEVLESPSADAAPTRPQNVAERTEQLETLRQERQAAATARRAALQERAQTRIINLAANTSNRMDATLRRFDSIHNRLESRIEKIAADDTDVSAARERLASAQRELDRARATLQTIDIEVIQFVSSENPQANWLRVRNIYTDVRDTLKVAHSELRATTELLKTPENPATDDQVTE